MLRTLIFINIVVLMIDLNSGNPLFFDSSFNQLVLLDDELEIEESLSPMLDKRAKQPHDSCGCPFRVQFLDLGSNSFPSQIKEKVCDEEAIKRLKMNEKLTKCTFGATCQKFFYEIKYLAPIEPSEPRNKIGHAHKGSNAVPFEIKDKYHWKLRNISIDCRCRHISNTL